MVMYHLVSLSLESVVWLDRRSVVSGRTVSSSVVTNRLQSLLEFVMYKYHSP